MKSLHMPHLSSTSSAIKYMFMLTCLRAVLQSCKTDRVREQAVQATLKTLNTQSDSTYSAIKKHIFDLYGDSVVVLNDPNMTQL